MTAPARVTGEPPADRPEALPTASSEVVFAGTVWDVRRDVVDLGRAGWVTRELIDHPGGVGVLALDEHDRVPLVHQYRHPVRMRMWDVPAGVLDVAGEPPHLAARRELAEEADLRAGRWDVLADWIMTPGGSSEAFRLYLARDLARVPAAERHQRFGEELDMPTRWFPLDQLRDAVLGGRLHSPPLVIGVLAACAARDGGWSTLRPPDAPWPAHPRLR